MEIERVLRREPVDFEDHPQVASHASRWKWEKTFEWTLESSIQQLWPYVSDTERLNRAIGLPPVNYRSEKDPELGLRKYGSFRLAGLKISWEEHPFEWIEGTRMGVLREFASGPFVWFMSLVSLHEADNGKTLLRHCLRIKPRNLVGKIVAKIEADWKGGRHLRRVYHRIDRYLQGQLKSSEGTDAHEIKEKLTPSQQHRIEQRTEQMTASGVAPEIAEKLARFLKQASPQSLVHLRPLALAKELDVEGDEMVDACLVAASIGLFIIGWDILCPSCRAPAKSTATLSDLRRHAECEACEVDIDTRLGDSVEMIFRAHPEVRVVDDRQYCIGGPENLPHVIVQVRLKPMEKMRLGLELAVGDYLIRAPRLPQTQGLRILPDAIPVNYELPLSEFGCSERIPRLRAGRQTVILENDQPSIHLVRVERTIPRGDVLTAAQASTLPRFRELFPNEILNQDNPITAENMTLFAVKLENVDDAYRELGDSQAYNAIQDQLARITQCVRVNGGAVSQSSVEGVLAAFAHCEQAVRAGCELSFEDSSSHQQLPLSLGVGVHRGQTLIATRDSRLDYFGATARMVKKLADSARGTFMLSDDVYSDRAVAQIFGERFENLLCQSMTLPGEDGLTVHRLSPLND